MKKIYDSFPITFILKIHPYFTSRLISDLFDLLGRIFDVKYVSTNL